MWTGRSLHPAPGVVKAATAATSAAPESFVLPQRQRDTTTAEYKLCCKAYSEDVFIFFNQSLS